MNAHHVDLPLSLGAYMMFSPGWKPRDSFSSLPKDAVALFILMYSHLLRIVQRGESPARRTFDTMLPDETVRDIYRIVLTGETAQAPDLKKLYDNLSELFFDLQIRDRTRIRRSIWERAGEDSLRGIFLRKLREKYNSAQSEERELIEQAARWGLAALDNMEEVVRHEDK